MKVGRLVSSFLKDLGNRLRGILDCVCVRVERERKKREM